MAKVTVSAVLNNLDDSQAPVPVVGETIAFSHKLSSGTTMTTDPTGVTDDKGTATITLTLQAPNTYVFNADYAGNTTLGLLAAPTATVTQQVLAPTAMTIKVV